MTLNQVMLQTDFASIRDVIPLRKLVFDGPIDEHLYLRFGRLSYRTLTFEHSTADHQPVGIVNYPLTESYPDIRIQAPNRPAISANQP